MHAKIKLDIYNCSVYWFLGNLSDFQEKYKLPSCIFEDCENVDGLAVYYNNKHYIYLNDKADIYNVVPHECLHVVCDIFKVKEIEFDNDNHEHASYLLGYIAGKIFNKINNEREHKKSH